MSFDALNWARAVRGVTSTQKLILFALADRAREGAKCWPSIQGIAADCCLSIRATETAIRALKEAGLLSTETGGGRHRTTLYILNLELIQVERKEAQVDQETPHLLRKPRTKNGVSGAETPQDFPKTPHVVPETPHLLRVNRKEPEENHTTTTVRRASRLPPDWQPSVDDCAFASGLGLDSRQVAERFRDYWHAAPGAKGVKANWPATWRNWCRSDAERQRRAAPAKQSALSQWADLLRAPEAPAFDFELTAEEIKH